MIICRRLTWTRHITRIEAARKILTGKPTGKTSLGRPRRRWKDNIGMNLKEIVINKGNWVDSTQCRENAVHQLTLLIGGKKFIWVWWFKVASCMRASLDFIRFLQKKLPDTSLTDLLYYLDYSTKLQDLAQNFCRVLMHISFRYYVLFKWFPILIEI